MKIIIILIGLAAAAVATLLNLSYEESNQKKIQLLRIEDGCRDIFHDLNIRTEVVKTYMRTLSKEDAERIKIEPIRHMAESAPGVLKLAERVLQDSYEDGSPLLRVMSSANPDSYCVYNGYSLNSMSIEQVIAGGKMLDDVSDYLRYLDTNSVRNNTYLLRIEKINPLDRLFYTLKVLYDGL